MSYKLVVNFGGPGSSGRDFLSDFARSLPRELRDRFDIVVYDDEAPVVVEVKLSAPAETDATAAPA